MDSLNDFEAVNPHTLPSVAFEEIRQLPDLPGLYFVLSDTKELLYVGRAGSLKKRWRQHHRAVASLGILGLLLSSNFNRLFINMSRKPTLLRLKWSFAASGKLPTLTSWTKRSSENFVHSAQSLTTAASCVTRWIRASSLFGRLMDCRRRLYLRQASMGAFAVPAGRK